MGGFHRIATRQKGKTDQFRVHFPVHLPFPFHEAPTSHPLCKKSGRFDFFKSPVPSPETGFRIALALIRCGPDVLPVDSAFRRVRGVASRYERSEARYDSKSSVMETVAMTLVSPDVR